jgi:hypothetical protein
MSDCEYTNIFLFGRSNFIFCPIGNLFLLIMNKHQHLICTVKRWYEFCFFRAEIHLFSKEPGNLYF